MEECEVWLGKVFLEEEILSQVWKDDLLGGEDRK